MSKQQQPDLNLGIDFRGNFNLLLNLTAIGAAMVRPLILSGQGIRAYGLETLIAFALMPLIGIFAHDEAILSYWKLWCLMLAVRKLTPNRRIHTDAWGRNRLLGWLTLGLLGNGALRCIEPIIVAVAGLYLAPYSVPLSRLIWWGAFGLAIQYRIGAELVARQREAIHNATIEAGYYR